MNAAVLPAPTHLRARKVKSVDQKVARSIVHRFASDPSLLTGSNGSATRAALQRLVEGLAEEETFVKSEKKALKKEKKKRKAAAAGDEDADARKAKKHKKSKKHHHE